MLDFGREERHVRKSLAAWGLVIPRLESTDRKLEDVYYRSISDLASLRLRDFGAAGELPAAGMPWFMTLFGRDTLITSLQTLLFGPDLAFGGVAVARGAPGHRRPPRSGRRAREDPARSSTR